MPGCSSAHRRDTWRAQPVEGLQRSAGIAEVGELAADVAKERILQAEDLTQFRPDEAQHAPDLLDVFARLVDGFVAIRVAVSSQLAHGCGNFPANDALDSMRNRFV